MERNQISEEMTMSTRKTMFALAAIAALATSALAPTSASAHLGGFGPHVGSGHIGFGHAGWGHFHVGFNHYHWWPHGYCWHWNYCHPGFHVGVGVTSTVVSGGAAPASTPAPAPSGGCLSKRELSDGQAVFKDHCTGEQAESQPQTGNSAGH
jgi:hypothetical protein